MGLNPQPRSFLGRGAPLIDPKTGRPTRDFEQALIELFARTDPTLTRLGQVQASAPVTGRTEGVGTTVSQLTPTGLLVSADKVAADGATFLRSPQFIGTQIDLENANFEASALLPPPGWFAGAGVTATYDIAAPHSGTRSLKASFTAQFQAVSTVRKWAVRPGDAFRLSNWVKSDGVSQIYTQVTFLDAAGAFLTSGNTPIVTAAAWTFTQATMIAPVNAVAAVVWLTTNTVGASTGWYDDLNVTRNLTAFELTPTATSGTPRQTTGLCTQHLAGSTQIDVSSSTWQFGDGPIAYNSGTCDPGVLQTSYVTGDDPAFLGGAIIYVPRAIPADANAANGRLNFGTITTAAGVATSTGGGSGGGGPRGKAFLN